MAGIHFGCILDLDFRVGRGSLRVSDQGGVLRSLVEESLG